LSPDISGALWSADLLTTQPDLIKRAHADYFAAGATIAITSSYQASVPGLVKQLHISEDEAKDLIKKSVQLAQEGAAAHRKNAEERNERDGRSLLVAGSVGPYATFLADGSEYRGDYIIEHGEMKDFHRGRIAALVAAEVDVLACETMPTYREISALAELLSDEFPSTEVYFSFTLRDAERISDGTPLADVVKMLERFSNVVAVGVNCVQQDIALAALQHLRTLTNKPLLVYPNSGEIWNHETRDWEGSRTAGLGWIERTRQYWDAGARMIGGCCRTTPDDIRVIAETMAEIQRT
jgi:homocysteine S-methyltransferase